MKRMVLLMLIISSLLSIKSVAQGNLLVTPMRLIFDGSKNNQELNLVNIGTDTAIFTISFIQYKMKEDGAFIKVDRPADVQMAAQPLLRIYPQTVTLAPGEPQVIMLQFRHKSNLQPGEYLSHLYFRAEKNIIPPGSNQPEKDTTNLSIQLIPVYGLCIPIIIRTGEVKVSITLSDLKMESAKEIPNFLKFTINRSGNISSYGDIIVDYLPEKGKATQIGVMRGIGVYTDIDKRIIAVKINNINGSQFNKGKLKVRYINKEETKNSSLLYADGELDI